MFHQHAYTFAIVSRACSVCLPFFSLHLSLFILSFSLSLARVPYSGLSISRSLSRSGFDILWTLMRLKIWCWKISTVCMQYFGIKLKYILYIYWSPENDCTSVWKREKNPCLPRIVSIWHKNLMLQIKFVFT